MSRYRYRKYESGYGFTKEFFLAGTNHVYSVNTFFPLPVADSIMALWGNRGSITHVETLREYLSKNGMRLVRVP